MCFSKEAEDIAQIILDRNEIALIESVTEALHRQPTQIETSIAVEMFSMGACCAAEAMIEGLQMIKVH